MRCDEQDLPWRAMTRAERTSEQIMEVGRLASASRRMIAESLRLLRRTQPLRAHDVPDWRR